MRAVFAGLFLFSFATVFAEGTRGRLLYPDGKPASNARVYWVQGLDSEAHIAASVITNNDGTFVFDPRPKPRALQPDSILAQAEGAGLTASFPYSLVKHPDLYLRPAGSIRTRVTDGVGKPVVGVRVRISMLDRSSVPRGMAGYSAVSDSKGNVTIPRMPQQSLAVLRVDDPRFAGLVSQGIQINRELTYVSSLQVVPAATLEGVVADLQGKPVSGVPVRILSRGWGGTYRAVTNAKGVYRVLGMSPGMYSVALETPTFGVAKWAARSIGKVTLGSGAHGKAPILTLEKGGVLMGQITEIGSGTPRSGLVVRVRKGADGAITSTVTDDEGRYAMRLESGASEVSYLYEPFVAVKIPAGKSLTRDIVLPKWPERKEPDKRLTVSVVDGQGNPVPHAELLQDSGGFGGPTIFTTDRGGRYTFTGYEVRSPMTFRAQSWGATTGEAVTVTSESELQLVVKEGQTGGVKGVVLGPDRKPVAGVPVTLFEKAGSMGSSREVVLTNAKGEYQFAELWSDCSYQIFPSGEGWEGEVGREVTVPPGKTVEVEATTVKRLAGSVAGRIVDSKGKPVSGVQISSQSGNARTVTDSKGQFQLLGLRSYERMLTIGYDLDAQMNVPISANKGLKVVFTPPPPREYRTSGEINAAASKDASELDVRTLDGAPLKLSDLRGKIVVIDFWGTDCGPCVGALPGVQRLWKQYQNKDVVVVGLHHSGGTSDQIRAFMKDHPMGYLQVIDEPDSGLSFGKTCKAYGVNGIPSVMVIDRSGKLVARDVDIQEAFEKVGQLLAEPAKK